MNNDFRKFSNASENVSNNYKIARENQNINYVLKMKNDFKNRKKEKLNFWDVIDKLSNFIDISDPDVNMPNSFHLFQSAESAKNDSQPEWFQLVCLIHDIGKIMYLWGNDNDGTSVKNQWGIVGDTFITGCKIPDSIIYPEFNLLNSDNIKYDNIGIYSKNCGLDNCHVSWGHDEFMYNILLNNNNKLPEEAYYIIRYHSLYLWHDKNEYSYFENEKDKNMKKWVKLFNKYDLYTKKNDINYIKNNIEKLKQYYNNLLNYYFKTTKLIF